MSYQNLKVELDQFLKEITSAKENSTTHRLNSVVGFDERRAGTTLDHLIEDISHFAETHGNRALTSKLAALMAQDTDAFRRNDITELEAKARRVDLALRNYADVDSQTHTSNISNEATEERSEVATRSNRVFVVHGHDEAILQTTCRLLAKLGLDPIVLREQANLGNTIIEKFEAFSDVGFAVVLMTADDMGGSLQQTQAGAQNSRARQNVIMELGYFISKLGRKHVAVLKSDAVEAPSDIFGVVYTTIDDFGAWRVSLGKELKEAGYSVDLNHL